MSSQGISSALVLRRSALALIACAALLGGAASASASSFVGQVTADVGGVGIDGVQVCAYGVSLGSDEACEVTEGGGFYQLSVEEGEYKLEFWPGYSGLNYFTEYFDDRELFARATRVSLADGETFIADAGLEQAGQIAGTVTAEVAATPLAGVEVCAYGGAMRCTETDGAGEYTLSGLVEGSYEVEFFPNQGSFMPQYFDNQDHWWEADPVRVEPGSPRTGIDAELRAGSHIEGTVVAAASGAPADEIPVCVLEAGEPELYDCDYTDAVGRYLLGPLPSNVYKVVYSPPWFGEEGEELDDGFATQYFNNKSTFAAADPLPLSAPAFLSGIDARLLSSKPSPLPLTTTPPVPSPHVKKDRVKKCRKGFKKKKVKGKLRCVKVHKSKAKGKKRGKASPRLLAGGGRVRIQP